MDGVRRAWRAAAASLLVAGAGCGGGGGSTVAALPAVVSSPQPAGAGVEAAGASDAFVGSIGVNVHFSQTNTAYATAFSTVDSLLQTLGVRHVRDGVELGNSTYCSESQQIAAQGIHFQYITQVSLTPSDLAAWSSCAGAALESYEGPNEYDTSGDPNWATTLSRFQQLLYQTEHGVVPVVGPSLTSQSAYAAVGNLSASADDGNMHDYPGDRNPGTPGWGATNSFGTYGSLAYNTAISRQATGALPVESTETGWADAPADGSYVPAATKARYVLRDLLVHWNAGVPHTYLYQFVDTGSPPFSSFGLVDAALAPKPAFTALRNLIAHLADPGATFTPPALAMTFGNASSVDHTVLGRRDGSYSVLVWQEASEWDPNAMQPIAVAPQSLTLTFARAPRSLRMSTFDDAGNLVPQAAIAPTGALTISVGPAVSVIDISP